MSKTSNPAEANQVDSHTDPDQADDGVEHQTVFRMLGNERRRHVIDVLRERTDAVSLDRLADRVAAMENEIGVEEVTATQRKRVYTSLQQTHLPKMDDCGVLTFDKEAGLVTPDDSLTRYTLHLDVISRSGLPESLRYLGLAAASVALVCLVWAGVPPFGGISPLWGAAGVILSFSTLAGVQWLRETWS